MFPILFAGCSGQQRDNPYLNKMEDTSYGGLVTLTRDVQREAANGSWVSMSAFEGQFVWVDYAAPWCQPCHVQAPILKALEPEYEKRVTFLTVMTAKSNAYDDHADRSTAQQWAAQYGLDPGHVVAATNLWSRKIPTHILFSPQGQMLYYGEGVLSQKKIRQLLQDRMKDWFAWSQGR